jgi:hypothetical protein
MPAPSKPTPILPAASIEPAAAPTQPALRELSASELTCARGGALNAYFSKVVGEHQDS